MCDLTLTKQFTWAFFASSVKARIEMQTSEDFLVILDISLRCTWALHVGEEISS